MDKNNKLLKWTLILLTIGVWILVFQNAGIFPRMSPQIVAVDSALLIKGEVDVNNTVFVKGSVDANIESINGYSKFYKDPRTGEFYVLPVTDPYQ
jgi:hypothetical protein